MRGHRVARAAAAPTDPSGGALRDRGGPESHQAGPASSATRAPARRAQQPRYEPPDGHPAAVALLSEERLAGVHSHPDAYPTAFESSLPIFGGCDGIGGTRERREERVALRVHLNTPVALKPRRSRSSAGRDPARVCASGLGNHRGHRRCRIQRQGLEAARCACRARRARAGTSRCARRREARPPLPLDARFHSGDGEGAEAGVGARRA